MSRHPASRRKRLRTRSVQLERLEARQLLAADLTGNTVGLPIDSLYVGRYFSSFGLDSALSEGSATVDLEPETHDTAGEQHDLISNEVITDLLEGYSGSWQYDAFELLDFEPDFDAQLSVSSPVSIERDSPPSIAADGGVVSWERSFTFNLTVETSTLPDGRKEYTESVEVGFDIRRHFQRQASNDVAYSYDNQLDHTTDWDGSAIFVFTAAELQSGSESYSFTVDREVTFGVVDDFEETWDRDQAEGAAAVNLQRGNLSGSGTGSSNWKFDASGNRHAASASAPGSLVFEEISSTTEATTSFNAWGTYYAEDLKDDPANHARRFVINAGDIDVKASRTDKSAVSGGVTISRSSSGETQKVGTLTFSSDGSRSEITQTLDGLHEEQSSQREIGSPTPATLKGMPVWQINEPAAAGSGRTFDVNFNNVGAYKHSQTRTSKSDKHQIIVSYSL